MTHPKNTATVLSVSADTEEAEVVRHINAQCVKVETNGFDLRTTTEVRLSFCRDRRHPFEVIGINH